MRLHMHASDCGCICYSAEGFARTCATIAGPNVHVWVNVGAAIFHGGKLSECVPIYYLFSIMCYL